MKFGFFRKVACLLKWKQVSLYKKIRQDDSPSRRPLLMAFWWEHWVDSVSTNGETGKC